VGTPSVICSINSDSATGCAGLFPCRPRIKPCQQGNLAENYNIAGCALSTGVNLFNA
jgi:hypothetical protein